jgi:hypothetical protein
MNRREEAMGKKAIAGVALSAVAILCGILLGHSPGVKAVATSINIKDLPEAGLSIIGPQHSSFDGEFAAFVNGRADADVLHAMRPACVMLKNLSGRSVVAYRLLWELTRPNGFVVTQTTEYSNPAALMDGGSVPGKESLHLTRGHAIPPGSARLISPHFSIGADEANSFGSLGSSGASQSDMQQSRDAAQQKDMGALARIASSEFQDFTAATVSIDGAIFEDGSFVGPDSTNFFATSKAHCDARHDLLAGIAAAKQKGMTNDQIFAFVASVADAAVTLNPSDPTASYNYFRKIYARELISVRAKQGDERALAFVLNPLRKQWVNLRKR